MAIMNTKKLIIFCGVLLALVTSCKDYLDPWPNGNYDTETIWNYQNLVQGLVTRCYDNIAAGSVGSSQRNYNDNEGAYFEGATDNAVLTSTTNVMSRYAANTMLNSNDPFQTYWDRDYRSISQCNLFLADRRGYNTRYMVNDNYNNLVKNRLQGEAFALRAWFEWDLLQKFGGKGTNGQMLGFPIITNVINVTDEINYTRNTYDECVKQILDDLDSAYKYLPIAHRDFLVASVTDLVYAGSLYWGRFDGITTRAMKSNVYLTWASPRFNPTNDITRWDNAAKYAKEVIDFKLTVDGTLNANNPQKANAFDPIKRVTWTNPNSPEIVFSTRYNSSNTVIERMFYPGGFQGNGEIGATQELVDAFGDNNGRPITHASTTYVATNPYANREPRFYSAIFYNTAQMRKDGLPAGTLWYTYENWNENTMPAGTVGKDAAGTNSKNSRTNYFIKKFTFPGLNWSESSPKSAPHAKNLITWTHMVLNFAEAANHATHSPTVALYSLTAKDALKYIRYRRTYDDVLPAFSGTDSYLDEAAAAGETVFDDLVKRERRIETCFEGFRFYDLRRWTTDATWQAVINAPVHGAYIVKTGASSYTYNLNWLVEERKFPSPYNPIPYNEMLRMSNLIQNEGWPSWN